MSVLASDCLFWKGVGAGGGGGEGSTFWDEWVEMGRRKHIFGRGARRGVYITGEWVDRVRDGENRGRTAPFPFPFPLFTVSFFLVIYTHPIPSLFTVSFFLVIYTHLYTSIFIYIHLHSSHPSPFISIHLHPSPYLHPPTLIHTHHFTQPPQQAQLSLCDTSFSSFLPPFSFFIQQQQTSA